jgi:hypothetical protein
LLNTFACSTGPPYEAEVEAFVQKDLLAWMLAPGAAVDDPRALLLFDEADPAHLVAVAAHERLTELQRRGTPLPGIKAQVVAVALTDRGTRIAGRRPGDLAFAALRSDARRRLPGSGLVLAAVVADGNRASAALCDRQGLTVTIPRCPGYVWRVGRL